jgi:hypothetical protein
MLSTTLLSCVLDRELSTAGAYCDIALDIDLLADVNYAGNNMGREDANVWTVGLDPYGSGMSV